MTGEPMMYVRWRANVQRNGRWYPLEVHPFSRNYDFDCEGAAWEAVERNDGREVGYQIVKVEIIETVAEEMLPA